MSERLRHQVVLRVQESGLDGALKLVRSEETKDLFRNKAFVVVLEALKVRCQMATEAEAVTGLFGLETNVLLAGFHLHGAEPQDDGSDRVWRGAMDFRYSLDGSKAAQAFHFDLQPFSYGDLTFHAGRPKPGKLARAAQAACEKYSGR